MTSKDVLVLLSKSGQTSELINLIPVSVTFFFFCIFVLWVFDDIQLN